MIKGEQQGKKYSTLVTYVYIIGYAALFRYTVQACKSIEVKLPHEPVFPLVSWLVCLIISLKGGKFHFGSYRSTCYINLYASYCPRK